MANENKDISEIVKKCKILLLDIEGTTTSISFVKDKLFPYAEENVKQFLESQWESDDVKEVVIALRKLAVEDKEKSVDGVVAIPAEDAPKEEQIEGLVSNVKWQMSLDRKQGALKQLQGLIWKQGYDNGDIKGHVYDDVQPALELWRSTDGQKVYIYSSGSVAAQKLLFGQSLAGDLLPLIDGHFDTAVGGKQEAASYAGIVEKIGCKPEEILFLTDILKEAEAARASGLQTALVARTGNAPLGDNLDFIILPGLHSLSGAKKRKPDTQEELPAKIQKTDIKDDVKANSKTETVTKASTPIPESKEAESSEQMEVDVSNGPDETKKESDEVKVPAETKKAADAKSKVPAETKKAADAKSEEVPVVSAQPVVTEEKSEKTDEKQTENMDTVSNESAKPNKVNNCDKPVSEETSPVVITEIEDVSDKPEVSDAGEVDDGLEPVIEEPSADEEMEELQNVGEVLEKECDEILSKVQDVTNLDNIPLKPLLNTITEEDTMETENLDTNDIVERILDSELELEMKQCQDIDLNTVQEITDAKTDVVEEKNTKKETDPSPSEDEKKTAVAEVTNNEKNGTVENSSNNSEMKVADSKTAESVTEKQNNDGKESMDVPMESSTHVLEEPKKTVNSNGSQKSEESTSINETQLNKPKEVQLTEAKEAQITETKEVAETTTKVADKKEALVTETKEALVTETKEAQVSATKEAQVAETKVAQVAETKIAQVAETNEEKVAGIKEAHVAETKAQVAETIEAKVAETKEAKVADTKEAKVIETKEVQEADKKESEVQETKEAQANDKMETSLNDAKELAVNNTKEAQVTDTKEQSKDFVEPQLNGKATNGNAEVLNGDASKEEELKSRLAVEENGKEAVNGSNGTSNGTASEPEVVDIKVKSVAVDESRTDPVEPTQA